MLPGITPSQDASAEALGMAEHDKELGDWLIKRTVFDQKAADVSSSSIMVPLHFQLSLNS